MRSTNHAGLCTTCVQAPDCSYRHRSSEPVMFCEEFEVDQAAPVTSVGSGPTESALAAPTGLRGGEASDTLIGLCVNCDHRDTCALPKPEGGVWHCEEFS